MPYAVAMAKGYFKKEGANVTGILTSAGGGTSLRNMLTGNVPYGEINPGLVISAIQQGAKLRIISDNVITVGEFIWAVKPDSPITTIADFKGRKIGYTNPRSTSVALDALLLQSAGYKATDAELVKTGGFGEGIPALDLGLIDVAPLPEPLWSQFKSKYRMVAAAAQLLPPLDNVVGVTTADAAATHGDFLRAIIRARRLAVNFMIANPDEAGDIVAKVYNLDPTVARSAVHYLTTVKTAGLPYWGQGDFHLEGLAADDRIAEIDRCHHRRGRSRNHHRPAIPARRSEGDEVTTRPGGTELTFFRRNLRATMPPNTALHGAPAGNGGATRCANASRNGALDSLMNPDSGVSRSTAK